MAVDFTLSSLPSPSPTQHVWPPSPTRVCDPFLLCDQVCRHSLDGGTKTRASGGPDPHPGHGEAVD